MAAEPASSGTFPRQPRSLRNLHQRPLVTQHSSDTGCGQVKACAGRRQKAAGSKTLLTCCNTLLLLQACSFRPWLKCW